jgi:pimeloyl-ACP methyl ester carboxylesterase
MPAAGLIALLLALGPTDGQTPTPLLPPPISANAILPRPLPAAPLADWNAAVGRKLISLTIDKVTLRGWEYPAKISNAPTVLFFGGNSSEINDADQVYRTLADGVRVVAYDYRGYGFSEGRADVRTFRRDALRLYDALATATPGGASRVAVFGFSMGTAIAAYVASERKVAGMVLVAPISNAHAFFDYLAPRLNPPPPDKFMTTPDADEAFDGVGMVAKSTAPLLVVHGDADDTVPYAEGKEVFAASRSAQKSFVTIRGAKHNEAVTSDKAFEAYATFFATLR